MHVLVAPDKFKGTAEARTVAAAMAAGVDDVGGRSTLLPLADGGEGTLDALGGANRWDEVTGPLGEPVGAGWRLDGRLAVVEMAQASGLQLAGGEEGNDPVAATSRGTGELIALARSLGAQRIIVGVGGSACTDGGRGLVEALGPGSRLDGSSGPRVVVASDVRTTYLDAARRFAAQKGADEAQVHLLTERLRTTAAELQALWGIDPTPVPGSGAGGGVAGALVALGAGVESGFELVAAELDLAAFVRSSDLVLTGEGRLDRSSFEGKVVGGAVATAAAAGRRAAAVVGQLGIDPPADLPVVALAERFGIDGAVGRTLECIRAATSELLTALARPTV